MLDAARAAAQSDPSRNGLFSRRWTGPPPWNRKGPDHYTGAPFGNLNLSDAAHQLPVSERSAQRAMRHALGRAAEIERRAVLLEAIGLRDASLRLGALAATIRAEVLT
jgi:hypothetical protein